VFVLNGLLCWYCVTDLYVDLTEVGLFWVEILFGF
jgi:hypothetical protein